MVSICSLIPFFLYIKAKKTIITEKIFYHYVKVNMLYQVIFLLNKFAGYQLFLYLYSIKKKIRNGWQKEDIPNQKAQ